MFHAYLRSRTLISLGTWARNAFTAVALLALACSAVVAQECSQGNEIDSATRAAIDSTAQRYVGLAAQGDVGNLRQASIPLLAANFDAIAQTIMQEKGAFSGTSTVRKEYLLDASSAKARLPRAEFFCGVYGPTGHTSSSAGFVLTNLDPGRYALVVMDTQAAAKGPYVVTLILQQVDAQWKLAGFYPKAQTVNGHNPSWFLEQARAFKSRGQVHNAWFYYLMAWDMNAPVNFMSTLKLDQIATEMQPTRPSDIPSQATVPLVGGARTYELIEMFPIVADDRLSLVVKYRENDISNTAQTFQDNTALMRALLQKYPEYREGFQAIVARAVAPNGQDYGTLLAMKDIK